MAVSTPPSLLFDSGTRADALQHGAAHASGSGGACWRQQCRPRAALLLGSGNRAAARRREDARGDGCTAAEYRLCGVLLRVLRVLRILRVLRLLKDKRFKGLKDLLMTLVHSAPALVARNGVHLRAYSPVCTSLPPSVQVLSAPALVNVVSLLGLLIFMCVCIHTYIYVTPEIAPCTVLLICMLRTPRTPAHGAS